MSAELTFEKAKREERGADQSNCLNEDHANRQTALADGQAMVDVASTLSTDGRQ